jgi:hypothetical protein
VLPCFRCPGHDSRAEAVPDATAGTPKDNQYSRRPGGDTSNYLDPDSHRPTHLKHDLGDDWDHRNLNPPMHRELYLAVLRGSGVDNLDFLVAAAAN